MREYNARRSRRPLHLSHAVSTQARDLQFHAQRCSAFDEMTTFVCEVLDKVNLHFHAQAALYSDRAEQFTRNFTVMSRSLYTFSWYQICVRTVMSVTRSFRLPMLCTATQPYLS